MPPWFNALLLIIAVAGFVFLFIQDRMTRTTLSRIMAKINGNDSSPDRAKATLVSLQDLTGQLTDSIDESRAVKAELDAQRLALSNAAESYGLLTARLEQVLSLHEEREVAAQQRRSEASSLEAGGTEVHQGDSAEIRRFLLEEGFSRIEILGAVMAAGASADGADSDPSSEGETQYRVRAVRGEELRSGRVTIVDGRIIQAQLEVPTALFP